MDLSAAIGVTSRKPARASYEFRFGHPGMTIMAGPRRDMSQTARDIFVNREGPIETVERTVAELGDQGSTVLVFHGPGGQGKTALCRYMARHLPSSAKTGDRMKLRVAALDLHGHDKSDPDRLLARIRDGFVRAGVNCPAFDLTFAIAWEAYRPTEHFPRLEKMWLAKARDYIGDAAVDVVQLSRELLEDTLGTVPLLGPLIKHGANWSVDRAKLEWLRRTREHLGQLYSDGELKKPYELSDLMPWMLAQDLNHHLSGHAEDRFVLLVDEYERVFDQGGAGKQWEENPFDRAMRQVVAETDGLLAVFFSRERLPWENDPDWKADLEGCHHSLAGLKDPDAERWLTEAGVTEAALRAAMIYGARESSHADALTYPLLLELQTEHWRDIEKRNGTPRPEDFTVDDPGFSARCRKILDRLLRDYGEAWQYTLKRLSVAGRFDEAAFGHVIDTFGTGLAKDAFGRLAKLSFVNSDETGFLTLHRAVRDVLRLSLDPEFRRETASALLAHYEPRATPPSPKQIDESHRLALFEASALRQQLGAEHFVSWLSRVTEPFRVAAQDRTNEIAWRDASVFLEDNLGEDHLETAASYNNTAYSLDGQGRYAEAEPLYRKALEIRTRVLGEDHRDTANSYNNIAYNLGAQGHYAKAEPLYRKALEISIRVLGEDHPDTAINYNNIAGNLDAQGRHAEAEPLYRKALEIRTRVLGEDHRDTATNYNNIASNLGAQGHHAKAEPLYRKALEIRIRVLGKDHPNTATSYNNIASNLDAQGRHDEAEPLYQKALEIRTRVLGEDHPNTATSYSNIAYNLGAQGRHTEAEPLLHKALEIRTRVLGEDHPDMAMSYNNIASNLDAQGRHAEAEPLLHKALEIRTRVLGEDHPDTATSYNNIASNLDDRGHYDEAEPFHRKALEIRTRVLVEDHPDTATSYNNIASNLDDRGRHAEAEPLYRKALEIRTRVLGEDHPETATSCNNIASNLDARGHYDEAEPFHRKALEIRTRVLVEDHPDTATSYNNFASNLDDRGCYAEAEPLYRKALEIRTRVLGEDHPDTATSCNNFASNLDDQGRYVEAEPLYRKAVETMERALGPQHPHSVTLRRNLEAFLGKRGGRK